MRNFGISFRLLLLFFLSAKGLQAQNRAQNAAGEYHLQGVMETASALLLKPDSTFELFFSYGAIDRQGTGRWRAERGKISLNSKTRPQADFALITSNTTTDTTIAVKILNANSEILPHFEVMVRTEKGENYGKTNTQGEFRIPKSKVKSIELFFEFCPERFSTFSIQNNDNYFEFKIEPWITEIFAENVILTQTKNGLSGQHPLLKGDAFEYQKIK